MVLDLSEISYKMEIPELCSLIRNRYMVVANQFVLSGDYAQKRKKYILNSLLWLFLFVLIDAAFIITGLQSSNSEEYLFYVILLTICLTPGIIVGVLLWQGTAFSKFIKQYCVRAILHDLLDIENLNQKENINNKNFIYDEDLRNVSLRGSYTNKYTDDSFTGKYKNADYALDELKLYRGYGKNKTTIFEGFMLKTIINTGVNGWIEILSRKCIDKPYTFVGYFILYFFVGIIIILMIGGSYGVLFNWKFTPYIITALLIIGSIIAAKYSLQRDKVKQTMLERQCRESNFEQITANYIIKASDGIQDVSKVVTSDLADVLGKLGFLFHAEKIQCKFYNDNVMLAVHTDKNLFEIGGLFRKPTNPSVAEPFIAQFAGIVTFMDYLTSVYK